MRLEVSVITLDAPEPRRLYEDFVSDPESVCGLTLRECLIELVLHHHLHMEPVPTREASHHLTHLDSLDPLTRPFRLTVDCSGEPRWFGRELFVGGWAAPKPTLLPILLLSHGTAPRALLWRRWRIDRRIVPVACRHEGRAIVVLEREEAREGGWRVVSGRGMTTHQLPTSTRTRPYHHEQRERKHHTGRSSQGLRAQSSVDKKTILYLTLNVHHLE